MLCACGMPAGSVSSRRARIDRRARLARRCAAMCMAAVGARFSSGPAGADHRPPRLFARAIRGLVGEVHATAVGVALVDPRRILQVVVVAAGLFAGLLLLAQLLGLVLVVDGLLALARLVIGLEQFVLVGEPRDFGRIRFIDVD